MNTNEFMEHLKRNSIVEIINGRDAHGQFIKHVYYKLANSETFPVCISGTNIPYDDPFKINFTGKFYDMPAEDEIEGKVYHIHTKISHKHSVPKNINILDMI